MKSRHLFGFVSPREYHSISRGYILNEIFRRADPKKRTLGEFID